MAPEAVSTIVVVLGGFLTAVLLVRWLKGRPFGPGDARGIAKATPCE